MKHVIALSGGKDSTALALRLLDVEPRDYTYIGNWTGNELPEFFLHLRRLEALIGKEITPVAGMKRTFGNTLIAKKSAYRSAPIAQFVHISVLRNGATFG